MLDENVVDKLVTVFYTYGKGGCNDMSEIMDEYTHLYRVWNKDLKHVPKEESKQETLEETLEEASENYVRNESDNTLKLISKYSFKDGAKWQQKRMYSK